ncbi:hypothetical protein [Mycoplasma sp. Ms02]|uniref:hypothetical protein n=1 Tax=Mycoplasma sp. Ms02 TaxID=353851 RepID=UPI001C8AE2D7|nr:hypothetical protein [Mycoplasma sp. Ms02]QZE12341.1 hypothetical protein K4L35_03340 [Mycoplasma sp. Ms02]
MSKSEINNKLIIQGLNAFVSLDVEQQKVEFINKIKSYRDGAFLNIIKKLKITDDEIFINAVSFQKVIKSKENPDFPYSYSFSRNPADGIFRIHENLRPKAIFKSDIYDEFVYFQEITQASPKIQVQSLRLANPYTKQIVTGYKNYLKEGLFQQIPNVLVLGNKKGKTYFGNAILNLFVSYKYRCGIVSSTDLQNYMYKKIEQKDAGTNDNLIDSLSRIDFLVIDDLGAEKSSDWFRMSVLQVILKNRKKHSLPTMLILSSGISNLNELITLYKSNSANENLRTKTFLSFIDNNFDNRIEE